MTGEAQRENVPEESQQGSCLVGWESCFVSISLGTVGKQTCILGRSALPPMLSEKQDDWDRLDPPARARERAGRGAGQRAGRSRF